MPRLTPELERSILAGIRAGGFPHVAAAAFGVSSGRFERWLARGRGKKAREPYRSFARKVDEAHAQARLHAEMGVHSKDPRLWLRAGPGKEQPGQPGWTAYVNPRHTQAAPAVNPLSSPRVLWLHKALRTALIPFPEAYQAVADAMAAEPDQGFSL